MVARFLCFIYKLGDSFYLKKKLYFIQAQLCGPAIHGPQGINVQKKIMLIPVVFWIGLKHSCVDRLYMIRKRPGVKVYF